MWKALMTWLHGKKTVTPTDDFRRVVLESSQDQLFEQVKKRVEEIQRLSSRRPIVQDDQMGERR